MPLKNFTSLWTSRQDSVNDSLKSFWIMPHRASVFVGYYHCVRSRMHVHVVERHRTMRAVIGERALSGGNASRRREQLDL